MKPLHDPAVFSMHVEHCIDTNAMIALLDIITSLPDNPAGDREGGFLAVYDLRTRSMVSKSFGNVPEEKAARYLRNATEKATRLVGNGQSRSMLSRDVSKEMYGGGVQFRNLIVAFSGLPEKLDEALSFLYLAHVTYISGEGFHEFGIEARALAKEFFSDNEFIMPVLDVFIEKRHK